jgi:hypothetical protein
MRHQRAGESVLGFRLLFLAYPCWPHQSGFQNQNSHSCHKIFVTFVTQRSRKVTLE